jgi:Spx/MgsR family transcriptional regulator
MTSRVARSCGYHRRQGIRPSGIACDPGRPANRRHGVATTIYGIKNCDTMKKARQWLDANGISYAFHDYKIEGIDRPHLEQWVRELGWETVLNRAGTTFRKLDEADKQDLDAAKAIALMQAQPSMIKRPILDLGDGRLLAGFKAETYAAALK